MPDRLLSRTLSELGAFRRDLGIPLLLVHGGLGRVDRVVSPQRTESDLGAKGIAADDTIDALKTTVDEQKGAAKVATERSELSLRRFEDQLQNSSLREAAQARASTLAVGKGIASCEDGMTEVDKASFALSLLAAESTHLGDILQPPLTYRINLNCHSPALSTLAVCPLSLHASMKKHPHLLTEPSLAK